MGYMRGHTIVVASWEDKGIEAAHVKASEIFPWVSPICPPQINGWRSFFIPPDGSKEGWPESDKGDERRRLFKKWANKQRYEDNSTWLHWVEVSFMDDDGENLVIAHD